MNYVLKNIKTFAAQETVVFLMTVVCVMCSAIIINFAFGFYRHLQQEEADALNGIHDFAIDFQDETRQEVTKGRLLQTLLSVDESVLQDCVIYFYIRFPEDVSDDPVVDTGLLLESTEFCIEEGKITPAPLEEQLKERGILIEGSYFTQEQFDNGELVCLSYAENTIWTSGAENREDDEQYQWSMHYRQTHNGKYTVHGKEYTSIGILDDIAIIPVVPITTLEDDCFVMRVYFQYSPSIITRDQFNAIAAAVQEEFGSLAVIPDLSFTELDNRKFYRLMAIFTAILSVLSGVVVALLYEYIIMKRKKKLMIFRLCGLSRAKAAAVYFAECAVIMVTAYAVSTVLYHNILLPFLGRSFVYMPRFYHPGSYLALGGAYLAVSLLFMLALITGSIKDEISDGIREVD